MHVGQCVQVLAKDRRNKQVRTVYSRVVDRKLTRKQARYKYIGTCLTVDRPTMLVYVEQHTSSTRATAYETWIVSLEYFELCA